MRRSMTSMAMVCVATLGLVACDRATPAGTETAAPGTAGVPTAAAGGPDAELELLKSVAAVNACETLTPEKLKTVYPLLSFEVHQEVEPQMSGYVWDSRCVYWAGVGSHDFAKDVPTHTVDLFVATSVSEAKAEANLASRHETATTVTGYQPQPTLGENAHAVTNTGIASLFFVKGQSMMQINVSDLESPNEIKIKKAVAIAQAL